MFLGLRYVQLRNQTPQLLATSFPAQKETHDVLGEQIIAAIAVTGRGASSDPTRAG